MSLVTLRRQPNSWPDAQRTFRQLVEAGEIEPPRRRVLVVWWRDPTGADGEVRVACYEEGDVSGEQPLVVFPTHAFYPAEEGTAPGELVGEDGLNATCYVALHGKRIWPNYNPVTYGWHPPPHDRPPRDFGRVALTAVVLVVVVGLIAAALLGAPFLVDLRVVPGYVAVVLFIGQRVSARRRRGRLRRAASASRALPPAR
jgi:hypothetical protein